MVTTRAATNSFYSIPRSRGNESPSYAVTNLPTIADFPHQSVGGVERVIEEGTDIWAIMSDMISISPLRIDVTDHDSLAALEEHVAALKIDLFGDGKRG
jgi:broad specificity polyphosphatase/5'/3'-nucleotidase SurE